MRPIFSLRTASLALVCAFIAAAPAWAEVVRTPHVEAELVVETTAAPPGGTTYVALRQKIIPGWHTYWRNPGDAGQATSIAWTLPQGWRAGEIVWPTPRRVSAGPIMSYVYTGEVYLPVPLAAPMTANAGTPVHLQAAVAWLVCKDICIPEHADLSLDLPIGTAVSLNPRGGQAIADTLAATPKPAGLTAHFTVVGDKVKLSVGGAPLVGLPTAHAYFFPFDGTLLDQAGAQTVEHGPQGMTLTLPAGYAFTSGKTVSVLAGVIAAGGKAYELSATPGALLAGTTGMGPPVASTPPPEGSTRGAPAAASTMGLAAAVVLAFLGGLVLNLMPCVFPILSIKAAALVRHTEVPAAARREGLAFLAGVVSSLMGLAILLIAARAAGQAVGWGFQLQSPVVVVVLALVMFAAGLNLSGVFEIGLSAQGIGAEAASRRGGMVGAALTGVLAVVVAAPCTAPFMAAAIGWAVVQPWPSALAVFLALSLGLGAPFTVLSFTPGLFRRMPRPGAWMEALRHVLAFPMYAAAAWLAWVFALQAGVAELPFLFAAAVVLGFAAVAWGAAQKGARPGLARGAAIAALVGVVACVVPVATAAPMPLDASGTASTRGAGGLPSEPWSPERVAALRSQGHPVFVDFTAAWCVTCQVNERTALATGQVRDAFARTGAVYLKADWTRPDARIAKALSDQGRSGVPLYLVYGASGEAPAILPQLLTPGAVVEALQKARAAASA